MTQKTFQVLILTLVLTGFMPVSAHAQAVGQVCLLGDAAKLFVGQSGKTFSVRLKRGDRVTLKAAYPARWLVKSSTGQLGYLEAGWMKRVCSFQAAEQGDEIAQFILGDSYDEGEGVIEDDKEAARWYRLAAEQGDVIAQLNLGVRYAEGEGVIQDK